MGEVNVTVLSIIIGYMVLALLVGLWASRKVKNSGDFLIAGGKMGFLMVAVTLAGGWEGTGASIGVTQASYSQGIYTSFYSGFFAAGLILTVFTLLKFARFAAALTPAQLLGQMFGVETRLITSVSLILSTVIVLAMQLVGAAGIFSAVLGIPFVWAVFAVILTAGLYTLIGGMVSNAWVNILHATIHTVMAIAAIPVVLIWAGGWDSIVASVPPRLMSIDGVGFGNLAGWWWTLGLGVIVVCFQQIQMAASSREAEKAFWFAAAFVAIFSVPFAIIGVVAAARFPGIPPLLALPRVAIAINPVFGGLLLAAVVAAALSVIGSTFAGVPLLLINDVWKIAKPRSSDHELLIVARVTALATGVMALGIAVTIHNIVEANIFAFSFRTVLMFAILGGLVLGGRRLITRSGGFWGVVCGIAGMFVGQFVAPGLGAANAAILFLIVGTAVVSAATRRGGRFAPSIWKILESALVPATLPTPQPPRPPARPSPQPAAKSTPRRKPTPKVA